MCQEMKKYRKVELLAPGGNLEKLKIACIYGADAVYIGGEEFGLRAKADNFSADEMRQGVEFAHSMGKKVYVTMNIIPRNSDFEGMENYIKEITDMGADAVIVSDPGIFMLIKSISPDMNIHISTQANNTNYMSAKFWRNQGAERIVTARELSLTEIKEISDKNEGLEIESFVHGAMCISFSGRCLLSGFMAGRDSNRGDCAHPCRWGYHLVEEKRPGEYMPVYENERGTYIFNSKDLCMIEHIPELIAAGVTSFKIEGRMKSSFYVATIVRAYRMALDAYYENHEKWVFNEEWLNEVKRVSHREYTTGFYLGNNTPEETQNYNTSSYVRGYDFVGLVERYDIDKGLIWMEQRNKVSVGDEVEVITPKGDLFKWTISCMVDENGNNIESAPHAQMRFGINSNYDIDKYSIVRRKA